MILGIPPQTNFSPSSSAALAGVIAPNAASGSMCIYPKYLTLLSNALLEAFADVTAQIENAGVGDAVEDAHAAFASCQKPSSSEQAELPGNIGLGCPRGFHQIRDILLPLLQSHQEF